MALVGLRDGIDIELWRLERNVSSAPANARRNDDKKAEAAYEDARSAIRLRPPGGITRTVSEALRLSRGTAAPASH
jgi:hypothetical protein